MHSRLNRNLHGLMRQLDPDAALRAAHPGRRKMLEVACEAERTAGELAKWCRISPPAASQHPKVLRQANLIVVRSEGNRRFYRVQSQQMAKLAALSTASGGTSSHYFTERLPEPGKGGGGNDQLRVRGPVLVLPASIEDVFAMFVEPEPLIRWIGVSADLDRWPATDSKGSDQ